MDTDDLNDTTPRMRARLAEGLRVGNCNTCTRSGGQVWVIQGEGRTVEFRMCERCMAELKTIVGKR